MKAWTSRAVVDPPISGLPSARPLDDRLCAARREARAVPKECNADRSVENDNKADTFGRQMVRRGQGWLKAQWNGCTWVGEENGWMECVDR